MPRPIEIRPARKSEVPELCQLIRRDYHSYDIRGTIYESALVDHYLSDRIDSGDLFLVAADVGDSNYPLGFAQIVEGEASVHLNHLVVQRSARGRGCGSHLLRAAIVRANERNQFLTLDVHSWNSDAIRFYANVGFTIESVTPVTMIPRLSGSFPFDLVKGNDDYKRYGFCYINYPFAVRGIRVGVVGEWTIRLFASEVPTDFDWGEFLGWARWADIFIYGRSDITDWYRGEEKRWEILRMKR